MTAWGPLVGDALRCVPEQVRRPTAVLRRLLRVSKETLALCYPIDQPCQLILSNLTACLNPSGQKGLSDGNV